ncbi:MAG: signal peptidase II [Candidatus Pacearchaeota archaeon]
MRRKEVKKRNNKKEEYNYEYLFLLFAIIVFIDRILKTFLREGCFYKFCIKKAINTGAAFGIFPGMTWFFIAIAIVILISIILFINEFGKTARIALVFIAAGTTANLIDRIFFGYVIDILSVFGSSSFNLADVSNCIGAIILIYSLIRKK